MGFKRTYIIINKKIIKMKKLSFISVAIIVIILVAGVFSLIAPEATKEVYSCFFQRNSDGYLVSVKNVVPAFSSNLIHIVDEVGKYALLFLFVLMAVAGVSEYKKDIKKSQKIIIGISSIFLSIISFGIIVALQVASFQKTDLMLLENRNMIMIGSGVLIFLLLKVFMPKIKEEILPESISDIQVKVIKDSEDNFLFLCLMTVVLLAFVPYFIFLLDKTLVFDYFLLFGLIIFSSIPMLPVLLQKNN